MSWAWRRYSNHLCTLFYRLLIYLSRYQKERTQGPVPLSAVPGIHRKSAGSSTRGDQLRCWLRGGSVRHRVDSPEKVPNFRSVSVIEGSERGSAQVCEMVEQPIRVSASAKNREGKVIDHSYLHPRITPMQSNITNAPTPHCIGMGGVGGKIRAISEWG